MTDHPRFEIRGEEKTTRFFLSKDAAGWVSLRCLAPDGEEWWIVAITPEGRLSRHEGVPAYTGLDVDDEGVVKLDTDT